MKLRLLLFGLMLLGLPVFWLFDLPNYLLFLSFLLFVIVVQSVVHLIRSRQNIWWLQILFFGLMTAISLFFAL